MVAIVSQKTKMVEQLVICEGDLTNNLLQQITQDIQNSLIPSTEKKGSLHLANLEKQFEENRISVLKDTAMMFGTY